jgi:putative ABC transport system permease protein
MLLIAVPGMFFLVMVVLSSMTLVVGAPSGCWRGGVLAFAVGRLTPIPTPVPLWSVWAVLTASALTGIGFGLCPASRAARRDPVDALRYE